MLSIQEQVYGLSQIWCKAKYNFVFWNVRKDIDWDNAYQEVLEKVMQPMEIMDYYLELMKFVALLNDGHTYVEFPREVAKTIKSLPIKIRNYNGKHVITNVAKGCDVPALSEIYEINGMDFNTYMEEKIMPYCWNIKPTSTYEKLYVFDHCLDGNVDKNAYAFISIMEKNKPIEISTSNGSFTIVPTKEQLEWTLSVELACSENLTEQFISDGLIIRSTEDNIAVITIPHFMDDQMPENFYSQLHQLKHYKGFIVDIRGNGGGNSANADAFSQAFIEGEFQTGKVKHSVHIGAYEAWAGCGDFSQRDLNDPWEKKVYDIYNKNVFEEEIQLAHYPECPIILRQPVVILENAGTGSSSENLLINFDTIGRATILGVPSYGTTGNPLFIHLPGNGLARICTRRYTYPNDKEFINIGIKPHIYKDLTFDDLLEGKDSILNEGLEILRKQIG